MLLLRFRSGMSSKSDLQGAVDSGEPIGVVADKLTLPAKLFTLPRFLDSGGAVFIDSGAFSEARTQIEPDWEKILRTYECVAEMANNASRLYVVAPDKVGDQQCSLHRLRKYRDRMVDLIELGCRVIVPIQKGALPAPEMLEACVEILGTRDFVAGIPSNKEAMSVDECRSLKHPAFHILGRVQVNDDQASRIEALQHRNGRAVITADANWLRSRLRLVQEETEKERIGRRTTKAHGAQEFDHPRAIAITRLIRSNAWL